MVPFPFSVFVIKTPDSVRVNIGYFWDYLWWQKKEIYLWICTSTRYKDHKCIIWWHINGSCDSINNVKITRELLSWRFLRAMACVELKPNTECKTHKGCTAMSSPRWLPVTLCMVISYEGFLAQALNKSLHMWMDMCPQKRHPLVLLCQMESHASWPVCVYIHGLKCKCSELKRGQTGTIKDALPQGKWCILFHNTMRDKSHHPYAHR